VIAIWLLLVVACLASGIVAGTRSLTDVQSEVGQSARADALLQREGLQGPASESILVTAPIPALAGAVAADLTQGAAALPEVASVTGPASSPALVADGGRIVLVQVQLRGDPEKADDHVASLLALDDQVTHAHPGVTVQEVGDGTENKAINDLIDSDLKRAELISLPITLIILVLAFGAIVAASVPLVLGITAVAAATGALGLVSHLAPNSDSTSAVVVLIGLAVGVDYSLFYVRREREERRRGRGPARLSGRANPESALVAAASSVGRAILISGLTVMVALACLLITGARDLVSVGLGTILVVALAVIGSVTVLPAMLALLGDRVDRGRVPGHRALTEAKARRDLRAGRPTGAWAGLARAVTGSPKAALVASVCVLGALAVPMLGMHTGDLGTSDMPQDLPVVQAANAVEKTFPGAPQSAELVVSGRHLDTPAAHAGLIALGHRAATATGGHGDVSVAVSRDGTAARVDVPMPDQGAEAAKATVERLRDQIARSATTIPGVTGAAMVTGDAASSLDYSHRMTVATPEVIGFVLVLGFLLLLVTFRAPLLAAAVMGLNLLSVVASYGILTLVFQHTWAEHLLGFHSSGHVIDWLPLFMFVILFGLSMDYTVLVLERIREGRLAGLSPREAAAEGVAATAGTVTSAAIVMVAVFSIFATLGVITFKELGIGLAAAVLLDATLVRGVALPAAVAVLGERGWPVRGWKDARVAVGAEGAAA
jgi:RND superfamily putative drug exporter